MAQIKLDNVCTTYYNIDGKLIAVATQDISRDGSKRFRLYKTDENLKDFELVSTADSPISFDAILYPNHVLSASTSKTKPIRTKVDIDKPKSKSDANVCAKQTKPTKRKKLF